MPHSRDQVNRGSDAVARDELERQIDVWQFRLRFAQTPDQRTRAIDELKKLGIDPGKIGS